MKIALTALAVLALAAGTTSAGSRKEARHVCAPDVHRLCPDLRGKPLRRCLAAHEDGLSADCKSAMAAAHLKVKQLHDTD